MSKSIESDLTLDMCEMKRDWFYMTGEKLERKWKGIGRSKSRNWWF